MQISVFSVYNLTKGKQVVDENGFEPDLILQNYTGCLNLLRASIDGLQESELGFSMDQDEWTIREIIHHITDGDYIWKICIQRALGEGEQPFHLNMVLGIGPSSMVTSLGILISRYRNVLGLA